jgi:hypothetical protein
MRLGVPPHALLSSTRLPAPSLLHLSTSARRLMRTVPGLQMVGEKAVIKWKRRMAESHGTGTASFSRDGLVGCYTTDPLRFIAAVAPSSSFPKLHMLTHAAEFARRFKALGRYSEAQIESYHARFNHKFRHTHRNLGANTEPRLRRSLADLLLFSAAVPMLAPKTLFRSNSTNNYYHHTKLLE